MKSYLKTSPAKLLHEARQRLGRMGDEGATARAHLRLMRLAEEQLDETFGVRWKGVRLLDVGCGQQYRNSFYFSRDNEVVAIDTEPPWGWPYVGDAVSTLVHCGVLRSVKTGVRMALGADRRFRKAYAEELGFSPVRPETHRMDARALTFPDASFGGAFSFSVLQHVPEPERAVQELHRVLAPGGCAYVTLHLYTSYTGSDHPLLVSDPDRVPPWAHLRPGQPLYGEDGLHCNRVRLGEWKRMFRDAFEEVAFPVFEDELASAAAKITPAVRDELTDYEDEELFQTTFMALARKA